MPLNDLQEDYEDQVSSEYLDEARDIVNSLDILNSRVRTNPADAAGYDKTRSDLLSLRGLGRYAHNALADVTVHRLSDYLEDLDVPTGFQLDDICTFTDILRGVLEGEIEHDGPDLSEFVRSLPVRRPADIDDIAHLDIEIMLVEPQRTTARIIERELHQCGYRVVTVPNALDAIALTVRTKPDMVIASVVNDELTGVDLACALGAMPATRKIPFALLTSFGRNDKQLESLPSRAALLRKGKQFGDDLAEALTRFNIT